MTLYDDEGNYIGPQLEDERKREEAQNAMIQKQEKKKKKAKRKVDDMEAQLASAVVAPDFLIAAQSPFAAQTADTAPANGWWKGGKSTPKKREVELTAMGQDERAAELEAERNPLPKDVQIQAAAQKAAKDAQEYGKTLTLWEQMNAERQHLAAEKKPKRIRNKNTNKETDMGHYHKADYYVPKGRADNFSGMFVAKETGEML